MDDVVALKNEWVNYIPTEVTIANHTFKIVQYKELYLDDDWIFGCFCYKDLEICVRIKDGDSYLPEEVIRNTYYHELFHCFNYLWNTEVDEALAQSFANFMREVEVSTKYAT